MFRSLLYDHPQGSSSVLNALPLLRLLASGEVVMQVKKGKQQFIRVPSIHADCIIFYRGDNYANDISFFDSNSL
jgi:hypothetical protein